MNNIERRALYNLLRMNWLNESTLPVEPWQVEDYHATPLQELFSRLLKFNLHLDRVSFVSYADDCDSPEDLTDHLIADKPYSTAQEDQIYLLIFELWRRLMSEKPSLSIVCNDLDYHIYLYDQDRLDNPLALQDALTHFVKILDENADQGIDPQEVLKLVSTYCANDIEAFLYDFISEQIDAGNESYAIELLDEFDLYLENNKWFKLLSLRLTDQIHSKTGQKIILEITEENLADNDLDFNLEFLAILAEKGNDPLFCSILRQTISLIKEEEDFRDLLAVAIDYFHRLDAEPQELKLKTILEKRLALAPDRMFNEKDPDLAVLNDYFSIKE